MFLLIFFEIIFLFLIISCLLIFFFLFFSACDRFANSHPFTVAQKIDKISEITLLYFLKSLSFASETSTHALPKYQGSRLNSMV